MGVDTGAVAPEFKLQLQRLHFYLSRFFTHETHSSQQTSIEMKAILFNLKQIFL